MAKMEGDKIIFEDGQTWSPDSSGVIGLSPELVLYEGFDDRATGELTSEQRREIADLMIVRWTAFRDTAA